MKDLLTKDCINLSLNGKTKDAVIDEMIDMLYDAGRINDKEEYKKAILVREEKSSTGLEEGIAIPHAKTKAVVKPTVAFGLCKDGVEWGSLDGEKSTIIFMIAAPEGADNAHIELLSKLTTLLLDDSVREKLLAAKSKDEVIDVLNQDRNEIKEEKNGDAEILAVTACPTGIAHTYMACEALIKAGAELGVNIKVETNGATGAKNVLTDDEIKKAKGIIVAADKHVDMDRFDGKKVVIVSVTEGIKNPKKLIEEAKNAPIYHSENSDKVSSVREKTGFYKHLMSGVSNMLPFVVGGGILIAISFMFGIKAFEPTDPAFHPFAKLLMDIGGGNAFFLMVPVMAGFIGMSIAERPGFAPAMVGGLISINNGGGFLGGLIAGFLGGYSIIFLRKIFAKLPSGFEGLKPVLLYPLFGIFITGALMYGVIVDPIAAINSGLSSYLKTLGTTNLVLLGILVGGMMAVDMGGPINKAAFTFGIAMIAAGNYAPHAAVMAGGMTPPLGIALATTIFKNKFTKEEREVGKTCYIMGLSFITEGAIPFAAADPIRVIPSCIIGSAIAGGLAMFFKVLLPAPHGGVFVIPVVTHPVQYAIAIVIGSVVTALLVGYLKKPIEQNN